MASEATCVTSPLATWIFFACLRNLRLALTTSSAMTGSSAAITSVSFQFIQSR